MALAEGNVDLRSKEGSRKAYFFCTQFQFSLKEVKTEKNGSRRRLAFGRPKVSRRVAEAPGSELKHLRFFLAL